MQRCVGPGWVAAAGLVLLCFLAIQARGDAEPVHWYGAPFAWEPPHVDGQLDDPVWATALNSTNLVRDHDGGPAALTTFARLAHDEAHLYVALVCQEPLPMSAVVTPRRPDDPLVGQDDSVALFLDTGRTGDHYHAFVVNASNARVQFHNGLPRPSQTWLSAVGRGEDHWSVEFMIPFDLLGASPLPGDAWGLNICRTRNARTEDDLHERSAWRATLGDFHDASRFGTLLFMGAPANLNDYEPGRTQRLMEAAFDELHGGGRWSLADLHEHARSDRAARLLALQARLERLGESVLVFPRPAISDDYLLPWHVPAPQEIDRPLMVAAAGREHAAAGFGVFAATDIPDLTVVLTPLAHGEAQLSLGEVFHVVCWFQAGTTRPGPGPPRLVPELLLRDPNLVVADPAIRENILRFSGYPRDAEVLQPIAIPAFESRQFWITFKVPQGTPPGRYVGSAVLLAGETQLTRLPIWLTIHPFDLEPPRLQFGVAYQLALSNTPSDEIKGRMAQELRNQLEHGINLPMTHLSKGPHLELLTDVYRELGLRDHPLVAAATQVGWYEPDVTLDDLRERVAEWKAFADANGYSELVLYGADEGKIGQRDAVREAGGEVLIATATDQLEVAGRTYRTNSPVAGLELPQAYRRQYGVLAWANRYDGALLDAYMSHGDDPALSWTDFHGGPKNRNMVYPAQGQPVDTVQWKGWRAGVDDVRYLTTVEHWLVLAEAAGAHPSLTVSVRRWLAGLTGWEDIERLRAEAASHISILKREVEVAQAQPPVPTGAEGAH